MVIFVRLRWLSGGSLCGGGVVVRVHLVCIGLNRSSRRACAVANTESALGDSIEVRRSVRKERCVTMKALFDKVIVFPQTDSSLIEP